MYENNKQKGSAIFFSVISMAVILGVAVGFNAIVFGGLQILKGTGNSAIAFYAAESGAENILFEDIKDRSPSLPCNGDPVCLQDAADNWQTLPNPPGAIHFSNGATYSVTVGPGAGCGGFSYCAKATGTFKEVSRRIEIKR